MKNRLFNLTLLLALVGITFTACKKDYPEPPIQNLPVGTVYTISEILAMESGTVFTEDASVYGVITADEQSGNLYKCAFMQDRTTGDAIELYLNAVSGVRIGDSVRIYLKGVTFTLYNRLPQLSNFEADGHIVILANNRPIEPKLTTIANINGGQHLGGLVRLENVKFAEQNTFAEPNGYGNRTLVDAIDNSQTVLVRTSNYANFANDSLPQGTGNLTAIASVYGNTWQLYIRSGSELEFNGDTPDPTPPTPDEPIFMESFANGQGSFAIQDVYLASGLNYVWQHAPSYSCMKASAYVSGHNYQSESWLVSPAIDLPDANAATLKFEQAVNFGLPNGALFVMVSTDYAGDVSTATWSELHLSEWPAGSNWTFIDSAADLSLFAGQRVTIAFKYTSTSSASATWEVRNLVVEL